MITIEVKRCCGTCFFWEPEGGDDFKERCKCRFREPYCRLDNKPRRAESGRGCLGWKPRE
ncbi:MAG: hypothetical protein ABRQ26_16490 [Syntrophomonadaceae bacterium]